MNHRQAFDIVRADGLRYVAIAFNMIDEISDESSMAGKFNIFGRRDSYSDARGDKSF